MSLRIEQDRDTGRVYLRIEGVSKRLKDPTFRITAAQGHKTLGRSGWSTEPYLIRAVDQELSGGDLRLPIEDVVVNHPDPGETVFVEVPELDLIRPMHWPTLQPISDTGVAPVTGPDKIELPHQPRPKQPPIVVPPRVDGPPGDEPLGGKTGGDTAAPDAGAGETPPPGPDAPSGQTGEEKDATPPGPQDDTPNEDSGYKDLNDDRDEPTPPPTPPRPWPPRWLAAMAAFVVGAIAGCGATYYMYRSTLEEGDRLRSENAILREFAFAPMASVVGNLEARSPNNIDPRQKVSPLLPDRAVKLYNVGYDASKAGQQREAIYWFRQATKQCETDSMTYLGDAYLHGQLGSGGPDAVTGFQLMRCAAALGNETARDTLGRLLKSRQVRLGPPEMGDRYQR